MLGKTNSNIKKGAGGSTLTAVNKTGAAISQGDKVWINNGSQVAGSQVAVTAVFAGAANGPVLDPSGTFGWAGGVKYSVTADAITNIGTTSGASVNKVIYGADNSMFIGSSTQRCDAKNQYSLGSYNNLIPNGNYVLAGNGTATLKKIDLNTGEVLKTYAKTASNSGWYVSFDNIIYYFGSSNAKKWTVDDDELAITETAITFDNGSVIYPTGVTADGKYIICGRTSEGMFSTPSFVRIVERISEDHLKSLPENEMPADLQPYFGTKKGFISFNPNNGVLAVVTSPTDYVVMQYANGVWHKLSIDLGYPEDATGVIGGVTFANDMSRCAIGYETASTGSNTQARFVNITDVTGYVAVPYKPYNISAETVTGYAKGAASVDGSFEANVASAE
jgi:hypothetical protein